MVHKLALVAISGITISAVCFGAGAFTFLPGRIMYAVAGGH